MPPETLETLVAIFKVLADTSRLQILGLLADEERSVEELATLLQLKTPTVSHHLKRLRERSLVSMRADGNTHWYRLNDAELSRLKREIFEASSLVKATEDLEMERYDRKVLDTFVVDGRLVSIPAQRKKRDVILRYLVERFDRDRDYSEREVNEIIKQLHADSATLRRELVGLKLMERDRGVYRRLN